MTTIDELHISRYITGGELRWTAFWENLRPRKKISPVEWAETFRYLSAEESPDYAGPFRLENIPALRGVLSACGEEGIRRIVAMKCAQIGWTAGVICSMMGYHAHWIPCVQIAMFPREKSAKDFDAEKFSPMVRATPALSEIIKLKSRALGNSQTRKRYPGGMIKLVASNSPSDVKSTSASMIYVEEPDDTNKDVRGQGNSITLLMERGKTIKNSFFIIGGTPTAKDASEIEREMRTTDQRQFIVECPHCQASAPLKWENVQIPGLGITEKEIQKRPELELEFPNREIYGRAQWENAVYACESCGALWTEDERIEAIRAAASVAPNYGWEATRPEFNDPGFLLHELLSIHPGSAVPILAKKFLEAKNELDRGDTTKMVAFWNSTLGRPWEYKGDLPEESDLRDKALDYKEWTVPLGGLIAIMGIDVQHDRLAVVVWVFGREGEMWLSYWGELQGRTIIPGQGAWLELENEMKRTVTHASGAKIPISGIAIDCSDGQTSDAVYSFVRRHNRHDRPVIAVKGASENEGRLEIWRPAKPIDPSYKSTKASKYGVQVHLVGTARAKDLILGWAENGGRIRLEGNGPGRMHWFKSVREDFYEQMLSEIKIPDRNNPKKRVWKPRTDRRNEALDATIYALYMSYFMRLHLFRPYQWDSREVMLRQGQLLGDRNNAITIPETKPAKGNSESKEHNEEAAPPENEPGALIGNFIKRFNRRPYG